MPNLCPKQPFVLVVDDQILVRICAAAHLEEGGFGVIEASDAEEALQKFDDQAGVTTVFTDIEMPGAFDGLSLAHKVFERRPEVQVILTSTREPSRDEMPPKAHFLAKPYDCNLLTELIMAA
jgi:DNA-binding NtrC family response regulator